MAELNEWRAQANCKGFPIDWFFPEQKEGTHGATITAQARELCEACPVRLDCLSDATFHEEPFGTWGGATKGQRDRLKRITRATYPQDVTLSTVRQVCADELESGLPESRLGRPSMRRSA